MKKRKSLQAQATQGKRGPIPKISLQPERYLNSQFRQRLTEKQSGMAGGTHSLQVPPATALQRFYAIPLLYSGLPKAVHSQGRIAFDSWEESGIGLRDVSDGHIRRVRLDAGGVTLELVAEHRQNRWEFVVRVYRKNRVAHDLVLVVGKRKMLAGVGGFYQWSSKSVVRRLALISASQEITFAGLKW